MQMFMSSARRAIWQPYITLGEAPQAPISPVLCNRECLHVANGKHNGGEMRVQIDKGGSGQKREQRGMWQRAHSLSMTEICRDPRPVGCAY